jgi:general secretion pathway protein L
MIETFLAWWAQHLLAWLPARLRGTGRRADALIAEVLPAGGLALLVRRGGREAAFGSFGPGAAGEAALRAALGGRRGPLVLRPLPGVLLQRPVELPLAAERDLGQVLRYEMDRLTPFALDEVHWGWAVERRDRARSRVHVLLLVAPKAALEPVLATLRRAGASPVALETAGAEPYAVPLDPGRPGQEQRRRRLLAVAAAGCAALAVVAAGLPFVRQSLAMRGIEEHIAALQPQVDHAQVLRRRIASGAAGAGVLATQRAATGDALAVLATVTDVLPDDTHLTELTLHGRVLTLTGQSGAAARLISALSTDPKLRDPAFIAPVTRNELAKADQFSIRAGLAP